MSNKSRRLISEKLDIALPEQEVTQKNIPIVDDSSTDITTHNDTPKKNEFKIKTRKNLEDDYDFVRIILRRTLEESENLLDTVSRLAKDSESPRALEVAARMIDSITKSGRELVNLSDELNKSAAYDDPEDETQNNETGKNIVNNNIIMTTEEMLSHIIGGKLNVIESTNR